MGELTTISATANRKSSYTNGVRNYWYISYLFSNTAYGLTIPLIPLFVVLYLGESVVWDGIVYSISSAASVPALILWGNLSDIVKKRKVFLIVGFLGSGVAFVPILFIHSLLPYVLFLVAAQVLGMSSVPVSNLLIFEHTHQSKWSKVMATFNTVGSVGIVLGLAIGVAMVFVYSSGVDASIPVFYLLAGTIYLVAAFSALFTLKESRNKLNRAKLSSYYSFRIIERVRYFPGSVIHIISSRKAKSLNSLSPPLRHYIYWTSFLMFAFQLFILAFPVYVIQSLGGTTREVFYLYLFNAISSTLTFRTAGNFLKNKGGKRTMVLALLSRFFTFIAGGALTVMALPSSEGLAIAMVVYALVGAFWGFISLGQISFVSENATPKNRGKAVGYYNSFFGIGQIGGSFVSGFISEYSGFGLDFTAAAVGVLIGTIAILRYYPHIRIMMRESEGHPYAD